MEACRALALPLDCMKALALAAAAAVSACLTRQDHSSAAGRSLRRFGQNRAGYGGQITGSPCTAIVVHVVAVRMVCEFYLDTGRCSLTMGRA